MTILFFVVLVAMALWGLRSLYEDGLLGDVAETGAAAVVFVLASAVVAVVFTIFSMGAQYVTAPSEERYTNIYSMGDGMGVKGGGFFFGSIDNQPVFMYYTKDNDGSFELRHMDADNVKIVESDDGHPRYVRECKMLENAPGWTKLPWLDLENIDCAGDYEVLFYVPKGSVKQQFNLDAS